jgi:hypothetical protein
MLPSVNWCLIALDLLLLLDEDTNVLWVAYKQTVY